MDVGLNGLRAAAPCLLMLLLAGPAAAAAKDAERVPVEIVSEHVAIDIGVAADGTAVETTEIRERYLTDPAARAGANVLLGYQPGYGQIEVIEAYTLKPDGTRIPVPPAAIQTQSGRAAAGAFSDAKTLQIAFPQVDAGSAIFYRYRNTTTKARFPGQFTYWNWFGDRRQWQDVKISVTAPDSLPMRADSRDGTLTEFAEAGRHHWTWTYASQNTLLEPLEQSNVLGVMYLPSFSLSSMNDYGQLASVYGEAIASKTKPTPASQKLADELTAGVSDPEAQARVLYDWVRSNVRYVQLYLNDGGLVPHDVDTILNARFGDCKDHAVLLGALLAAKHIASTPVLIGAGYEYRLPATAQPFVFNHMITYLPSLDRYIDSTARDARFDVLPSGDAGRSVLHVNDGVVRSTPETSAVRDHVETLTTMDIAADGSASGTTRLVATGSESISLRSQFENMNATQRGEFVRDLLNARGLIGEGTFQIDTAVPLDQYAVAVTFMVDNLINPEDDGAMSLNPMLTGPRRIADVANGGQRLKTRRYPYGCSPSTVEDRYEIRLPSALRVSLPKPVDSAGATLSYHSAYRRDGDLITVERKFVATPENRICTPADYLIFRSVSTAVLRDLRKQISYRQPAASPTVAPPTKKRVAANG